MLLIMNIFKDKGEEIKRKIKELKKALVTTVQYCVLLPFFTLKLHFLLYIFCINSDSNKICFHFLLKDTVSKFSSLHERQK